MDGMWYTDDRTLTEVRMTVSQDDGTALWEGVQT